MANNQNEIDNIYNDDMKSKFDKMWNKTPGVLKHIGRKAILSIGKFLGAYLIPIILAIVLLIILIGAIAFIFAGPDMVRGKIIKMADDLWTDVKSIFIGRAEAEIDEAKIVKVGAYLDNLGYKLEGYGLAEKGKVTRDPNSGKVTALESSYIKAYLVAENKTYMIANKNINLRDFMKDTGGNVVSAAYGGIKSALTGSDGAWGSGMIVLNNRLWEGPSEDNVDIDREKQILTIEMTNQSKKKDKEKIIYEYNLDGWMGRYGKPLEFLLALHTGTMAPDLAYQVAVGDEFDTKVYLRFKKISTIPRLKFTIGSVTKYVVPWVEEKIDKKTNQKTQIQHSGWKDYIAQKTQEEQKKYGEKVKERREKYGLMASVSDIPKPAEEVKRKYGINMEDVIYAEQWQEDNKTIRYKPYIRAVTNHWFRDLDFEGCYIQTENNRVMTGKKERGMDIEEDREGDIFQIKEPKIVGKDKSTELENLLKSDVINSAFDVVEQGTASPDKLTELSSEVKVETKTVTTQNNTTQNNTTQTTTTTGTKVEAENMPSYKQFEGGWENMEYWDSTLWNSGCIPTSFAMLASWATGESVTPGIVASYAISKGYDNGNYLDFFPSAAKNWNFTVTATTDKNKVIEALKAGIPVACGYDGGHPFTDSGNGHWVVYRGIDENGNILINNPGRNSSEDDKAWDPNEVLNNWNPYWIIPKKNSSKDNANSGNSNNSGNAGNASGSGNSNGSGNSSSGAKTSTEMVILNEYEGYKLDKLFSQKYHIADGINGVSQDEQYVKVKNSMRYAITMLENVHTKDAEFVLRDLKRYLTKRGFVFNDKYIMTDPQKIEELEKEDELSKLYENVNEYGGKYYVPPEDYTRPGQNRSTAKQKPLGGILDGQTGGVEIKDDYTVILHHKSANYPDGFETNAKVKSPGKGTVIQADGNTVKIKLDMNGARGYTITITGFNVSVKTGDKVSTGTQIGQTGNGDITVTMTDDKLQPVNPADYLPIISASENEVDELARLIQAESSDPEGMAAVAWVVIHRKESSGFQSTIHDVIWADGQFSPTFKGDGYKMDREPSSTALNIARSCLSGTMSDPLAGKFPGGAPALYFLSWKNSGFRSYSEEQLLSEGYYPCAGNVFSHDGHNMFN